MDLNADERSFTAFERERRAVLHVPELARGQLVAARPDFEFGGRLRPDLLRAESGRHSIAEVYNRRDGKILVPLQRHSLIGFASPRAALHCFKVVTC